MAKIKTWYVGWEYIKEAAYVYKTEQECATSCGIWKVIDAYTAQEAKDLFIELYMGEIDNIAPYNDNE